MPHTNIISWGPNNPICYEDFSTLYSRHETLGQGGDGLVESYRHCYRWDAAELAVKIPRHSKVAAIKDEIANLQALGKHEYIASMQTFCPDFQPIGPAIITHVCNLGDLFTYADLWTAQQKRMGKPRPISEATVWKLFRDMILGLDFMHDGHPICYVHTDLKPENILVRTPRGHVAGTIPEQPVFQITDFARIAECPTPRGQTAKKWAGTYGYAPPRPEREGQVYPAVDMWGLGATIQTFALNVWATQSPEAFIVDRVKAGLNHPELSDKNAWIDDHWLERIPVVYRPLNATCEVLWSDYDADKGDLRYHTPYSGQLNHFYSLLFDKDPCTRVRAGQLKQHMVPLADQELLRRR
jgi:serine/threonine protein kinase